MSDAGQGATVEDLSAAGAKRIVYAATNNRYDVTRGLSAAVLMRPRVQYNGGQPFLSRATAFGVATECWVIGAEAGNLYYWEISDAIGADFVDSTTAQSTSRTDLIVGTYDGANIRIYVNGKLEGTTATTRVVNNLSLIDVAFGPFLAGSELLVDFYMGAIWKRALTPQEIGRLYVDPYQLWRPTKAGRSLGFVAGAPDGTGPASMFLGM
jgi:hypothetical protein